MDLHDVVSGNDHDSGGKAFHLVNLVNGSIVEFRHWEWWETKMVGVDA